jgi:uncharacterized protein (DUF58 family)
MTRPALPLSRDRLRRFLFRARREMPSAGLGPTRRRRLGQSLEYREHREYVYGDDVRSIDWRASLRYKGPADRLVRSFEAEEQYSLIVALDVRPEMWAPEVAPPMLLGLWLAEALGELSVAAKLSATILPLFGPSTGTERPARGQAIAERFASFLDEVWAGRPATDGDWLETSALDASGLLRHLPPAAAVVIITDGTFTNEKPDFTEIIRAAQRARRHVALVVVDGWQVERSLLEELSVHLLPVGAFAGRQELVDPTKLDLDTAEKALTAARQSLRAQAGGLIAEQWTIPKTTHDEASLATVFRERFEPFLRASQIFAIGRA